MSSRKGNGEGAHSAATASTASWPIQVFEGRKSEGPDMKEAAVWLYRSVITVLLGLLVYTFQKTDRKVDDLTDRVPKLEGKVNWVAEKQAEQGKQLGLITDWVLLQPKSKGKAAR